MALAAITVMVMATAASAQTDKGDWMVGGKYDHSSTANK